MKAQCSLLFNILALGKLNGREKWAQGKPLYPWKPSLDICADLLSRVTGYHDRGIVGNWDSLTEC